MLFCVCAQILRDGQFADNRGILNTGLYACVCAAVDVITVHRPLVVSIASTCCRIHSAVFVMCTPASGPASPWPNYIHRAAVAREVLVTVDHHVHYVRHHLGCLVFCTVLDSDVGRRQFVIVVMT